MKLFVGLDVSSDKLDACFLTDTLTILHQGSYANDIEGATQDTRCITKTSPTRILMFIKNKPHFYLLLEAVSDKPNR